MDVIEGGQRQPFRQHDREGWTACFGIKRAGREAEVGRVLKQHLDILYFNLFFLQHTLFTAGSSGSLLAHKLCDHCSSVRCEADSEKHERKSLYSHSAISG